MNRPNLKPRQCKANDCTTVFTPADPCQRYCCKRCQKRQNNRDYHAMLKRGEDVNAYRGERDGDHEDCASYEECLTMAFQLDAPKVCPANCRKYVAAPQVMPVPMASNWCIETEGTSNRHGGTEEDREAHVRSKERRPLGGQVVMPWRLVG